MNRPKTRKAFLDTEEGKSVRTQLMAMSNSDLYNTESTFSPNKELYPNNQMPFEDKQINYIVSFPYLDASMYIANLKLRTRIL